MYFSVHLTIASIMLKFSLNLLTLILFCNIGYAQKFNYGDFTNEEVGLKRYDKDTSAHAFVINEYGTAKIDVVSDDRIKIVREYHVKIKILDTKGFDKGTVQVPIRTGEDSQEEVENVKGITTYTGDNGGVQRTELDKTKIFTVKENRYWTTIKFTMPNLRPGCIIEYKYTLTSPYWDRFPSWQFQDDIPKAHSEYEVFIPGFWTYNISLHGILKLSKNKSEVEKGCFSTHGASADCSHLTFGMDNIPAFIEEEYMTAPKNFLSAINFELSEYTNPYNSTKVKVTKEWKDIDYNLKHADYFGVQLRRKDLLKSYITPVIAGKKDDLAKAKAIYAYMQKTLKWNNIRAHGSGDGVRKTMESHTGNAGEINIALVTALAAGGLNAEAVLLSTRANGLINKLYPVEDDFDYVIAKINIGENTYLLDATDPLLAFGMLPIKCLNDQGRVMSLDKPSYWIDLKVKDRKSSTSSYDLTLQNNGKLTGTLTTYYKGYEAYEKRQAIKKFNSQDEYIESVDEKFSKLKILKADLTNVDSLDLPLSEKYEVEIDAFNGLNHDKFAFNPFFMDRYTINPFKLSERSFPVDLGMPSDDRFVVIVHLPADYVIESAPQEIGIALPNQGGKFITSFNTDNSTFMFSNIFQLNKGLYAPEEYLYLKELFNKVIAAQKAEIVFRKK